MDERLRKQLDFILEIDKEKNIQRLGIPGLFSFFNMHVCIFIQ